MAISGKKRAMNVELGRTLDLGLRPRSLMYFLSTGSKVGVAGHSRTRLWQRWHCFKASGAEASSVAMIGSKLLNKKTVKSSRLTRTQGPQRINLYSIV